MEHTPDKLDAPKTSSEELLCARSGSLSDTAPAISVFPSENSNLTATPPSNYTLVQPTRLESFRSVARPVPISGLDCRCPSSDNDLLPDSHAIVETKKDFIHVPGVSVKAYIPRQTLLKEIAASLGLIIYSTDVIDESNLHFRGRIDIDIPPSNEHVLGTKKTFYGELGKNRYHAMENVSQAVIAHLLKETKVVIEDANYNNIVVLEKRLQAARSFENIYREDQSVIAKYTASLRESNLDLLHKVQEICMQHADFLSLQVHGWSGSAKNAEDVLVHYKVSNPPLTACEKLGVSLADLASTKIVDGLVLSGCSNE